MTPVLTPGHANQPGHPTQRRQGAIMMDTQRNKATLQRLYDQVMNGHNLDASDKLMTVDRPDHDPTFPLEFTTGRAGFKKLFAMMIAAFPDLTFTTQLMVGE